MRLKLASSLTAALFMSGLAVAQTPAPADEHAGHHPEGSSPTAATTVPAAPAVTPDAFNRQMRAMQDMRQRMQAARTPAERAALMDEHMKLMQSGMSMMSPMRGPGNGAGGMPGMGGMGQGGMGMMGPGAGSPGMGGMGPGGMGPGGMGPGGMGPGGMGPGGMGAPGAQPGSGTPPAMGGQGMGAMMGMHAHMERRMALMEQMMQMMVDREAAVPRR